MLITAAVRVSPLHSDPDVLERNQPHAAAQMMHYANRAIAAPRATSACISIHEFTMQGLFPLSLCVCASCNSHTLIRVIWWDHFLVLLRCLPSASPPSSSRSSVLHTHLSPLMCYIVLHPVCVCLSLCLYLTLTQKL